MRVAKAAGILELFPKAAWLLGDSRKTRCAHIDWSNIDPQQKRWIRWNLAFTAVRPFASLYLNASFSLRTIYGKEINYDLVFHFEGDFYAQRMLKISAETSWLLPDKIRSIRDALTFLTEAARDGKLIKPGPIHFDYVVCDTQWDNALGVRKQSLEIFEFPEDYQPKVS